MTRFVSLLRDNRNYRYTWMGQVVSEIGDHFNNIAVFSLAVQTTHSGLVVSGVLLARAIPAVLAGPLAGVTLDRLNRKHVMIASDLIRAVVALAFILTVNGQSTGLLYGLSALLMLASPFFTSGRSSILPSIATNEELHTANSLTQTTQWTTLAVGAFLGGTSVMQFGYQWAFFGNSLSFVVFGTVHFAAVSARPRIPPAAPRPQRDRRGASLARIRRRPALHAFGAADSWDWRWSTSDGLPAAARRRSCSRFSASRFSIAAPTASA